MNHIVGASGIIAGHLKMMFNAKNSLAVQESGNWNFDYIAKGDLVFFLRSISSPFAVMKEPNVCHEFNVIKTEKAISEILVNGAHVIFASSDVVYGETAESYADEYTPINPHGAYANQKAAIEMRFKDDANFLSLRLSSVVGYGSNLRKLLVREDEVEIFDPVIRTPVHIDDLRVICSKLTRSNFREDFPNGVLNVGGHVPMSNLEVATLESKFLGFRPPVAAQRTELDRACRPGVVRMTTTKAQEFAKLSLNLLRHYN